MVLVGWDGASREDVVELLKEGQLPFLKRLIARGSFIPLEVVGETDTKAGWAVIFTGYKADVTGVYHNSNFRPIPEGYSVFERLKQFLGKDKIVTAAVISKSANMETSPGGPYFITAQRTDSFMNGLGPNYRVLKKVIEFLKANRNKRFFLFVHFGNIDIAGHIFWQPSVKYRQAISAANIATGKIYLQLKKLGLGEKTLFYITADHGFDKGKKSHLLAPAVFLVSNDQKLKGKTGGTNLDITPTILERFGINYKKIQPPLAGEPL